MVKVFQNILALGINWLHNSSPKVIHRDLKLTNLLVDEHMTVRIQKF